MVSLKKNSFKLLKKNENFYLYLNGNYFFLILNDLPKIYTYIQKKSASTCICQVHTCSCLHTCIWNLKKTKLRIGRIRKIAARWQCVWFLRCFTAKYALAIGRFCLHQRRRSPNYKFGVYIVNCNFDFYWN